MIKSSASILNSAIMNKVEEKEILEIEKIKKEIYHMTFKEWAMVASFFTALGAVMAKLLISTS